jgi:tRNA(Leu) C34 or U34 (ribose-2'-O)-methylase TrmL
MAVRCVVLVGDEALLDGEADHPARAVLAARWVVGEVCVGPNGCGDDTSQPSGPAPGVPGFRLHPDLLGISATDPRLWSMVAAAAACHPSEVVVAGDPDRVGRAVVDALEAAGARFVGLASSRDRWGELRVADSGDPTGPIDLCDLPDLPDLLERLAADDAERTGQVGVGPLPEPWPDDPRLDPTLLAEGDRRNVVDRYRYWREEAIVADLAARAHPFHVAVENWRHDRNIGAVVRNANAFAAAGVHIVGRRRWNRRGAMATDRYLPVHHHPEVADLLAWAGAEGLAVVGIDNVAGAVPLEHTDLPERCVLVFGQEGPGLSSEARAAATMVCAITQYGSTRSVNAGVASGIAMHAWVRRHGGPAPV